MNKWRVAFIALLLFDWLIGGANGGFIPQAIAQAGTTAHSTSIVSQPAAGTQATASIGAVDNTRHYIDQVCFSAGSTTAPALTQLSINVRDGASGAGTVLANFVVVIPAATGQNVLPFCTPINLLGSKSTAATVEFSAGLTNLFESVTLYYHDQP